MAKAERQHLVCELIEGGDVHNQRELVDALAERGVSATQATVSRDLEELGALKVRRPGGESVYAIAEVPGTQAAPSEQLRKVCREWVVSSVVSGNLVVLRTPPGSAHVVAAALDRVRLDGVAGTVAGDDTILVVAEETSSGAAVADRLDELRDG
ncbi:MAG: arginine repressor [Acidimicrobiia bacterium]|nr:arginine repressor [Acidimicrobiia bacterium]